MGICSDQEIIQLIGTDDNILKKMAPCIMDCHNLKVFTQQQALAYIGQKCKTKRYIIHVHYYIFKSIKHSLLYH